MTEIDTSAKRVNGLARLCEEANGFTLLDRSIEIAATLRALLRERDDLAADCVIRIALEADARHRADTERDAASAEVEIVRRAWLRVIQAENGCAADGACVNNKRCGCAAEQEMLIREAAEARAGLAGEGCEDG